MSIEAKLQKLISELDDARENGQVFTYGLVQERIREALKPDPYVFPTSHVTIIIDNGKGETRIIDIPQMAEVSEFAEMHEPSDFGPDFLHLLTNRGYKFWGIRGVPIQLDSGEYMFDIKRRKNG